MADVKSEHIPYQYISYNQGVAHHKIDGSLVEGLVRKVVFGVIREQGYFKKGFKDGIWESFRPNKSLRQRQSYKNGKLHGIHEWFHDNGNIRETGKFQNDERVGVWRSFDRFGNLTNTIDISAQILSTDAITAPTEPKYYDNLVVDKELLNSPNNLSEQHIFFCDERAFLKFDESPASGLFLRKYSTGFVDEVGSYKDGFKEGSWRKYRSNGRLKLNSSFRNGNLDGECTCFNPNGTVREKGLYKSGTKTGIWERYDSEGQLTERVNFDSNNFSANKKLLEPLKVPKTLPRSREAKGDGSLQLYEHEITVRDGIFFNAMNNIPIDGRFVSRKSNGDVIESGECENGIKQGEWKKFRINGKLKQKLHYENGEPHGMWEWFHDNGKIRERGFYKHGIRIGEWKNFDRYGNHTKTILQED